MRLYAGSWLPLAAVVVFLASAASCSEPPAPPPPVPPVAPAPDSKPSTPPQTPPPVAQSRPVVPVGRGLEQWLAKNADVVVQTMEGTDPVVVRVGQTLGITNPNADSAWQVDVPGEALKMLTPADKVNKPGESGWVWRAMEPGTIELALTARTPCPNPPCGQAVLRLTKTVEIKPRQ